MVLIGAVSAWGERTDKMVLSISRLKEERNIVSYLAFGKMRLKLTQSNDRVESSLKTVSILALSLKYPLATILPSVTQSIHTAIKYNNASPCTQSELPRFLCVRGL